MKEASEDFENMCKPFLDPKNLYIPIFGPLTQCIWSGFQNEKMHLKVQRMMIPRMHMKEATEHFENVYEHVWQANDLVLWDNRCTAHARKSYDPENRRRLRRMTITDENPVS